MKKVYPNYKGKKVDDVRLQFIEADSDVLNDFLNYCSITAGKKKIANIERIMLQIYDVLDYSYEFNLEVLRSFLSVLNQSDKMTETQNDIKKVLKRFLKWRYRDWSERFDGLRDVRMKDGRNHTKLNPSTLLKDHEIESLIRMAESLRYKAFVMLMYESAGRPEEILKLRWHDIDLERGDVKLHSSKTGRVRVNPIKESLIHLKRYYQEYPYPFVMASDFVFPSPKDRKKAVNIQVVYDYLKKISRLAINRPIFPYLFRHTRLTALHQKLSPKAYEKFADHSIETAIKHYSHLSNDDVRDEMLEKIYHVEEIGDDAKEVKRLESEVSKLSSENQSQKSFLEEQSAENNRIWEWLEKLTVMNKTILKTISHDKKLEVEFVNQLRNSDLANAS